MFSFIPPITSLQLEKNAEFMIQAYQIFHSTVNSIKYRSEGKKRTNEQHCVFHYTVKGHGEVIYNGKSYQTNAGEGFFNIINDANSGYGYPTLAKEPWEYVVICFSGGNVREIVKLMCDNRVVVSLKQSEVFSSMCKKLLNSSNAEIKFTFFPRLISLIKESEKNISETVSLFNSIVERDILQNPTVSAIASQMNMSREHLQRKYTSETGKTPAKYIRDKRFEILSYFLTKGEKEDKIADKMNFPSVTEMTMFFKKYSGITPRQYKQNGFITY